MVKKILVLAVSAVAMVASAQTIPASSLDSGSRATVAIKPMTSSDIVNTVNQSIQTGDIQTLGAKGSICGFSKYESGYDYSMGEPGSPVMYGGVISCQGQVVNLSPSSYCPSGYAKRVHSLAAPHTTISQGVLFCERV